MKITYNLEAKDYINFNLYQIQYSEKTKQKLEIQRIAVSVIFILIGLALYFFAKRFQLVIVIVMLVMAGFWYWNFPNLAKSRVKKSTEKAIAKGQLKNLFDEVVLLLDDIGITEITTQGEYKSSWEKIQSVILSKEYVYFFLSSDMAIIIPKRVIDISEFEQLKTLIDNNYNGLKKDIDVLFG